MLCYTVTLNIKSDLYLSLRLAMNKSMYKDLNMDINVY